MSTFFTSKEFFAIVGVGVLGLVFVLNMNGEPDASAPDVALEVHKASGYSERKTIATEWDWTQFQGELSPRPNVMNDKVTALPETTDKQFDLKFIYRSLQEVRIDNNGDVIVDHEALLALNNVLAFSDLTLDSEQLLALQAIIKLGLPGPAGEQTAEIVGNYYQFIGAEAEFNNLYKVTNSTTGSAERPSLSVAEAQYGELQALREVYLGEEVGRKLFTMTNASAQYMFDIQRLNANTSIGDEEKERMRKDIMARHESITIGVENWSERYDSFLDEKQQLRDAALSIDDKQSQLNTLLQAHFSETELEKVSHLALGML